jgi:hypothetical protein
MLAGPSGTLLSDERIRFDGGSSFDPPESRRAESAPAVDPTACRAAAARLDSMADVLEALDLLRVEVAEISWTKFCPGRDQLAKIAR